MNPQLGVIKCARMNLAYTGLNTINIYAADHYRDRKLLLSAVRFKKSTFCNGYTNDDAKS